MKRFAVLWFSPYELYYVGTGHTAQEVKAENLAFSIDAFRDTASMGLIGACVARDLKLAMFPTARAVQLWRMGTVSMMSPAPSHLEIVLPEEKKGVLMTLDRDINKNFDLQAVLDQPCVIIDFFRDVYPVLMLRDGRMITCGIDIDSFGAKRLGLDVVERIEAHDRRYPALWLESFRRFCEVANATNAVILIVPVFLLSTFWDDGVFRLEPGWSAKQIVSRNIILGFMQRIALVLLKNSSMVPLFPETLELDPQHEYGPGPYHYNGSAYLRAIEIMTNMPELVQSFSAAEERREKIAQMETEKWFKMTEN